MRASESRGAGRTPRYSGAPPALALDIEHRHRIATLGAPPGFDAPLGALPPETRLLTRVPPSHGEPLDAAATRRRR